MSAYLKRLDIANVDDSGESVGAYIKTVHIVEVVDSNGDPYFPATEIGVVTINPDQASTTLMGRVTFTAVVTGGDATDLTYKWSVRSGNAILDTADNLASAQYTFIREGTTQIQCSVSSAKSTNSPQSNISSITVA